MEITFGGNHGYKKWLRRQTECHCYICGGTLNHPSIDHIIPQSSQRKGVVDRADNIALACRPCHSSKSDKGFMDFVRDNPRIPAYLKKQANELTQSAKGSKYHQIINQVARGMIAKAEVGTFATKGWRA